MPKTSPRDFYNIRGIHPNLGTKTVLAKKLLEKQKAKQERKGK
jgi:hypothetical protein